ncbi:MAG TPA: peptide ligase PGM1-related protein, partial [Candidatus Limnocylindrales bacterium]|nr:peptide ligase PGM1-related protein [Candidatus Limnocylindrales bacterium]
LIAGRIPSTELIYILSRAPDAAVIEYYLGLMPAAVRDRVRPRIHLLEIPLDGTPRSVATRLLDRPDRIAEVRRLIAGRPAFIEPWNVTEQEVALALALDVPINGTDPSLREAGFKSHGRRLIRDAGVPVPLGVEDVRTVDDVVAAIEGIVAERPTAPGVVVKHDDSGAGDGNVVIDLGPLAEQSDRVAWLRARVEALPAWYLADLERGGIVEERIAGTRFTSPSAQVDIRPDRSVLVLATHEQVLGGEGGQVYLGCRFPADPSYAPELAQHAAAIGEQLSRRGALGRFSVDFVAAADGNEPPRIFAIEINLRKGGTTHPYAALRNAVPGHYDAAGGRWVTTADGSPRAYSATDNLVDSAWLGLAPAAVIDAVAEAGLQFDPGSGLGVVLHMLSGLAIDGRFGLTAIGRTAGEARELEDGVRDVVDRLCRTPRTARRSGIG